MTPASLVRLLALSAIWGASFLFMRMGAPVLGPTLLIACRVASAAVFLAIVGLVLRKPLQVRRHARHYVVLGLFNGALPFLLFAFAARTLSASLLSILNATAPIWGAVIAALWTRQAVAPRVLAGLAMGVAGVAMLVGLDPGSLHPGAPLAIALTLGATFSYGVATNYAKSAQKVDPYANAHGSMWAATLLIAPALPFAPAPGTATPAIWLAVLALGIVCSGIAFLLYFRLIADLGAASALTVTFLIPVFGVLWGHLFLGEPLSWHMAAGALVVIVGTALVTGFSPAALWRRPMVWS
ncbi:MAG: DMT family transporter [Burkholderiales bacterium]|nr:DMT family transporter [Burkholderiales bacterium]MDE1925993.1 DMT family transporter [Burkholderiales bacterium]MDE2157943.1 DMT family transporter [Burkholderiales bacterium]